MERISQFELYKSIKKDVKLDDGQAERFLNSRFQMIGHRFPEMASKDDITQLRGAMKDIKSGLVGKVSLQSLWIIGFSLAQVPGLLGIFLVRFAASCMQEVDNAIKA